LIKQLNRQGKTIIMASHILDEVEKVCTHVAIIQKGVLKTVGTVQEVMNASSTDKVVRVDIELAADNLAMLENMVKQIPGLLEVHNNGTGLTIHGEETVTTAGINKYCFEKGIVLTQLNLKRKSLETRFLEITGTQSDR
jgi:ABC-2 type transport system ATP-binding protein